MKKMMFRARAWTNLSKTLKFFSRDIVNRTEQQKHIAFGPVK